jgi:Ankyrin repeats (many copies)/Zinc finger, ZZ type
MHKGCKQPILIFLMLFRFLLVEFQLKHVLNKKTIRKRKDALGSLPSTIDEAYSGVIAGIEKLEADSKDLAVRTLSWIFHARRPLCMAELCEAVAIEDNQVDLDAEDLPSPSNIIDCCGSLVVHDSSGIVRFAHYTVSSFLENKYIEHLHTQVDMARACLTYLCFDFFDKTNVHGYDRWWDRMETYNFAVYASVYWDSYTRGLGEEVLSVQEPLFRFLLSPSKCLWMLVMRDYGGGSGFFLWRQRVGLPLPIRHPWLHIVAGCGLTSICRMVMERDETKATPPLQTSVNSARHTEVEELKEMLKATVKRDMFISTKDNEGYTPLHEAARAGYREVVIVLLENGADINARTNIGVTPLHLAAMNDWSGVVRTLLDKDADMTVEDLRGGTPLASVKIPDVVREFLDKIAKTTPWMLEELSTCTLHDNPSKSQIPKILHSSFGRDLYTMLTRPSLVPSPVGKNAEAFIASEELSISLHPVNASVTRANELTHPRTKCDGCYLDPIVGFRYKCAVCGDFDFCRNCYVIDTSRPEHFPESNHHFLQIPRDGWRQLVLPRDFMEPWIQGIGSDGIEEALGQKV